MKIIKYIAFSILVLIVLNACTQPEQKSIWDENVEGTNDPVITSISSVFGQDIFLTGTGDSLIILGNNFKPDTSSKVWVYADNSIVDTVLHYDDTRIVVIPQFISATSSYISVVRTGAYGIAKYEPIKFEKAVMSWGDIVAADAFGAFTIDNEEKMYWTSRFEIAANTYDDKVYKINTLDDGTYAQEVITTTLGYDASAVSGICIYENKLYAALQFFVYVFDLEKKDQAKQIFMNLNFTTLNDIILDDGYAYLVDGTSKKLYSIDTTGTLINGALDVYTDAPVKVKIFDNKLYVATQKEILEYSTIDPNTLGAATVLFTVNTVTDDITDFSFSYDDELYLSLNNNGLIKIKGDGSGHYSDANAEAFYSSALDLNEINLIWGHGNYMYSYSKNMNAIKRINMVKNKR